MVSKQLIIKNCKKLRHDFLMDDLPLIAITMGDPAGIGPEILVKAMLSNDIYRICRPFVLGDVGALRSVSREIGSPSFHVISTPVEVSCIKPTRGFSFAGKSHYHWRKGHG